MQQIWYVSIMYVHTMQGRHGEFEPGKVQYSTPKFFDCLFLMGPVSYKSVLKPKIQARTKSCLPSLPWRPWHVSSVCACQQHQLLQQSHQICSLVKQCSVIIFYPFALKLKVFVRLCFSCIIITQGECFRLFTLKFLMKVRFSNH